MHYCLWLFELLILVFVVVVDTSPANVFKFGAVLSTTGKRSDFIEAKRGYQLFVDTVNKRSNGKGFYLHGKQGTAGFYFKYDFQWREDDSDPQKHVEEVNNLIHKENIHFLGGSAPAFADDETRIANDSHLLNFHCCVGPDYVYERDYETVFGIHTTNREYTRMAIERLYLEDVKNFRILADESDAFTKTTCEAAMEFSNYHNDGWKSSKQTVYHGYRSEDLNSTFFQEFARESKQDNVEAVIACVIEDDSKALVDAFHEIKHPLKAFFITGSPTKQEWVDSLSPKYLADNLISAAQWHKEMKYSDSFFGSGLEYVELYENTFKGSEPTYVSAGASATVLTLHHAIKEAFRKCDIGLTNGSVQELLFNVTAIICDDQPQVNGYDRILSALFTINIELFYGPVSFNRFRRNVGHIPVTTQVLPKNQSDINSAREIKPVLPLADASHRLKFPAKNYYAEDCLPGKFVGPDPFDPCTICPRGTVSSRNNSDHCDRCPVGKYMYNVSRTECTVCPPGSTTVERGSVSIRNCTCLVGYYHPSDENGVACMECPSNAICNGRTNQPYPKQGYWMNETYPYHSYVCDPSEVCLGGPASPCKNGTKGRTCGLCEDGYYSILKKCYRCPNPGLIVVFVIVLIFGWYVLNVIVSNSVVSLEMILTWAQFANIIKDVNLSWPRTLTRVFGVVSILDFDLDSLEPSCIIKGWGFTHNFIVQLCLPLVMTFLKVVGYTLSSAVLYLDSKSLLKLEDNARSIVSLFVFVPESKADLDKKWDTITATFFSSIDVTYITIAKYCCDVFKCQNIAGVVVQRFSPSVECGTEEHHVLIFFSVVGIVFYVVGSLLYVSWKLYQLHVTDTLRCEANMMRFGFMYQKFESGYRFTFITDTVRKLLFVLVLVFLNDPAFQLAVLVILIVVSLGVHVFTCPYINTNDDVLFGFLLLALLCEAFAGLMFYNDKLSQQSRDILEWIVTTALFFLCLAFLISFVEEIKRKYYIRSAKILLQDWSLNGSDEKPPCSSLFSTSSKKGVLELLASAVFSSRGTNAPEPLFEIVEVLDPSLVAECMQNSQELNDEFQKWTELLRDYIPDQAPCSYMSLDSDVKFWRKMIDAFPETVDFLSSLDEIGRQTFANSMHVLNHKFCSKGRESNLPIMDAVSWNKRASVAHWLSTASEENRNFFLRTLAALFKVTGREDAAKTLQMRIVFSEKNKHLESAYPSCSLLKRKRSIRSAGDVRIRALDDSWVENIWMNYDFTLASQNIEVSSSVSFNSRKDE